jgi:ribonuclease E
MLEDTPGDQPTTPQTTGPSGESTAPAETTAETAAAPAKKAAAKRAPAKKAAARETTAKRPAKKAAAAPEPAAADADDAPAGEAVASPAPEEKPARKTAARRTTKKTAATPPQGDQLTEPGDTTDGDGATGTMLLFQPPDPAKAERKPRTRKTAQPAAEEPSATPEATPAQEAAGDTEDAAAADTTEQQAGDGDADEASGRRRRRRGGRRRRKSAGDAANDGSGEGAEDQAESQPAAKPDDTPATTSTTRSGDDAAEKDDDAGEGSSSRRRRRRRRSGDGGDTGDDSQGTSAKERQGRSAEDQITSLSGSTRLEAKKQRRREGREAGRRRAPIVSEAEFLARRESVDRVMAIRQRDDLTQIAVLEDKVLVEHYVARESQTSLIGNVYLGRVQNVLPSMEAAFIDIGKGRNAVLYAGEVNWASLGHQEGQPRKIESVLSSGQSVLVQVTKDPAGHKGARLTSQISLAGRFLVYVPDGTNSGISRKLPDTERNRLKSLLKEIVPEGAGVIVRTAAEGASEEELTRDVERLKARWEAIDKGAKKSSAPQLLYGEPDLTLKVVRDLFTEDFSRLVVQGDDAWETVQSYVSQVAPDLEERLEKYDDGDLFATYRIDEQIAKGLDRKVWLPSGGSLVIDRTEAMTVVDVNTGKFTGSGGNLEETVTKNNLEAAEEIVRQLRLRDIGGIIVIDFIDMVLESNRDLVLRRLVECLGRDRTRHQVAEVTSLGLVQMTRKRIGTGLLEAFSEPCTQCGGRGVLVRDVPVETGKSEEEPRRSRRSRSTRARDTGSDNGAARKSPAKPTPKDVAAMARAAEPTPEGQPGQSDEPVAASPDLVSVPPAEEPTEAAAPTAETAPAEEVPATEPPAATAPEAAAAQEPAALEPPVVEPVAPEPPAAFGSSDGDRPQPDKADEAPTGTSTVVTRTRRRSARRPAGPPAATTTGAAVGAVGSPPQQGAVEPRTAGAEPAAPPVVEHVPIKKRGSRKR